MRLINRMRQLVWPIYGVAVVATVLTLFLHQSLGLQADSSPIMLTLFILPILLSAFLGGLGPGLVATVLATFLAVSFLLHPISNLDHLRWLVLASEGLLISVGSEFLHRQAGTVSEQAALLDQAHVLVRDLNDRIVFWNKGAEALYGWTKAEAVGQVTHKLLQTKFPDSLADYQTQLFSQGHWEGELIHIRKDGSPIVVVSHQVVHYNRRSVQVLEVNNDITERKRAEELLKQSEQKYTVLFDKAAIPASLSKLPEIVFVDINDAFTAQFGYTRQEVIGKTSLQLGMARPLEQAQTVSQIQQQGSGADIEKQFFTKSGELRFVLININLVEINGQNFAITTINDVTDRRLAQAAVEESEARYRNLVENLPTITYIIDVDPPKRTRYISPQIKTILGFTPEEWVADPEMWWRQMHPEDRDRVFAEYERADRTGTATNQEYRMFAHDGREIWLKDRSVAIRDKTGVTRSAQGILEDITERKAADAQIQYQANLLQNVSDAIIGADLAFNIISWNKGAEILYGWQATEVLGKPVSEIVLTPDVRRIRNEALQSFRENGFWQGEIVQYRKDGSPIDVLASASVVRDASGQPIGVVTVIYDITERKRAEEEIKNLASFPSENLNPVLRVRLDGTLLYANQAGQALLKVWGCPPSGPIPEVWASAVNQAFTNGAPQIVEFQQANGTWSILVAPIADKGYVNLYGNDITQRKLAEEKSQRGEQILRLFVEHSPADIAMFDRDMRYIVFSRRYLADYDLGDQDLTGRSHYEVFPEIPERWKEIHRQCLAGATAHSDEDPFPRANGHLDWIRWAIHPWYETTGEIGGIILFSEIITEHKQLLEKIQQHALRLQFLTDISRAFAEAQPNYQALLDLIVREIAQALGDSCTIRLLSEDGTLLELAAVYDVDPQVLEYTRAHLLGVPLRADEPSLIQTVLQNPEPVLAQDFDPQQTGVFSQPVLWPIPHSTAEHSRILVRMSVGGETIGVLSIARRNPIWPAFNEDNFGVVRDLADRAALAISNAQLFHRIQLLNTGLEERIAQRTAQLAGANQELIAAKEEADRANQAKSEFLSRVSHELRTPLNAILGFAQIMEMEVPSPHQEASLRQILNAGRHLLDLINEVLDISRIETDRLSLSLEPVGLGEILQEAVDLIQPAAAQRIVRIILQEVFQQYVLVDRQRYKQILLNLLSNAVKYNREGGQVSLSYSLQPGPAAEKLVRLAVSDTGFGIPAEKLGRLFQPFDRLDAEASGVPGTGLGLALSKRLAEAMGGTLRAESTVGEGSTFYLETPSAQAPLEKIKAINSDSLPSDSPNAQARTILCIEDNLSNLNLIEHILARRSTIHLLTALQGGLGLELARQHRPDLILLDLNLPDVHGSQVLETLKADPVTQAIPVVVISADATHSQTTRLLQAGARTYLTKPLDVRRFLEILDDLLPPDL